MQEKEKIQKVNLSLYPSSITKAGELAEYFGRSVSNLLRWLIEEKHKKEFGEPKL